MNNNMSKIFTLSFQETNETLENQLHSSPKARTVGQKQAIIQEYFETGGVQQKYGILSDTPAGQIQTQTMFIQPK